MANSYKYFENIECDFFPCHGKDEYDIEEKGFNCLFCFCPLYPSWKCGGKFRIENGIKDCTNCSYPHEREKYSEIIQRLYYLIQIKSE